MLVFISQVYNFLPVPIDELYADGKDFCGLAFWYEMAVKIDKQNAAAIKKK
ncbi:MAG: hypothetical protein FWF51_08950 [Chitinivibrionia bacterium]|nr:hypothetical protein [Chitinivibrionia bacterium]